MGFKSDIRVFFSSLFLLFGCLYSKAQFVPVHESLGVNMIATGQAIFGHAVSVHDFDGDGWDDLSFGTTGQNPRFYRNTGSGFELWNSGISSPNNSVKSLLWADLDNDGDKDLFISYENSSVRLYENTGNMILVDITEESGIQAEYGLRNYGAAIGDYDRDGLLDIYLCKYYNSSLFEEEQYQNILYRNNGDLTFSNVTAEANASVGVNASFMPAWFDYNEDGWPDLFIVNDRVSDPNYLLRNNGDGSFTDVSEELGLNAFIEAMGFSPGDIDNDLLLDFFVANSQTLGNHLYHHQADHQFENIAPSAGVEAYDLCWSGLWMDYDNNGWLDLHVSVELHTIGHTPHNLFYVNNQDLTFTEMGSDLGLSADSVSTWASAQGDWNRDGYPDFVSHNRTPFPSALWENLGGDNHYLAVVLEGSVSNRDAIGAMIYAYAGGLQQLRYVACGENYLGQNSQRKLFGLGETTSVDSLIVRWPSGHTDRYYELAADSTYSLLEGSGSSAFIEASNNVLCPSDTLVLHAIGATDVTWSTGASGIDSILVTTAGTYSFEAENEFGVPIESPAFIITSASTPIVNMEIAPPLCFGESSGSINLLVAGDPETHSVVFNGLPAGWEIQDLASGSYSIVVSNAFGCEADTAIILEDPSMLTAEESIEHPACYGEFGSASLEVSGGSGSIAIDWFSADPEQLLAGVYPYEITDENACVLEGQVLLLEPEELVLEYLATPAIEGNDGSIDLLISGGTPPYTAAWTGPNNFVYSGQSASDLAPGAYSIALSDANGCLLVETIVLQASRVAELRKNELRLFPNPNHGEFTVSLSQSVHGSIEIRDLSGRQIALLPRQPLGPSTVIYLPELCSGGYLLLLHSESGTYFTKLMIQRP